MESCSLSTSREGIPNNGRGLTMRVFNSPTNSMAEVLAQLEAEADTLPAGFSQEFRAGIRFAVNTLRNGATNKNANGVLIAEATLTE